MGQDSWQAEQRRPYFLAKAGRAFAGWLALNIRKTRTSAAVRNVVANENFSPRPDRVNVDMPDSSHELLFAPIPTTGRSTKVAIRNWAKKMEHREPLPAPIAKLGQLFSLGHTTLPERNPTMPPRSSARGIASFFYNLFTMSPRCDGK